MAVTTVVRQVYVHARSEEALKRRIDTFISALRLCDGSVITVEERKPFRGRRLAVISYEFPLAHRRQRAVVEAPPPASGVRRISAASERMSERVPEKLTAS
jgi:hypothetical protein